MNPDLDRLKAYPFERLRKLKLGVVPPEDRSHIALSIGEPRHPAPDFVARTLTEHLDGLSVYPLTRGMPGLRESIAAWASRRFGLPSAALDPERHILPVNGTREALFAIAQCVVDRGRSKPLVLMPNPFYQIYEGAALLAGAQPGFMELLPQNGFLPDPDRIPDSVWKDCQLLYACTPGNPAGAVMPESFMQKLIGLAHEHDFIIAADECYSEIYFDEGNPPPGFLGAAWRMGNTGFSRLIVFHSLSKRSNLPGLRSGFAAGDARLMEEFHRYRTYHGGAMAPPVQMASRAAWEDEAHVRENRALYSAKFDAVLEILDGMLDLRKPEAGFYLWAETPEGDEVFARELFRQQNVTVLPGSYLSRPGPEGDPGLRRVRMALVAPLDECIEAARRIRDFLSRS